MLNDILMTIFSVFHNYKHCLKGRRKQHLCYKQSWLEQFLFVIVISVNTLRVVRSYDFYRPATAIVIWLISASCFADDLREIKIRASSMAEVHSLTIM